MSQVRFDPSYPAPAFIPYHALPDEVKSYLTALHVSQNHWKLLSTKSQHDYIVQFSNEATKRKPASSTKAATDIQKLWRGHQLRKNMALTFPSILMHRKKLELWSKSSKSSQDIENKLFAVHATDYFPMNGIIRVIDPKIRGSSCFRPTTHFALGELVPPQADGKISRENKKFAVISPLKDLIPQVLSLNAYDTYILGDFKLTKDSIVLVPSSETKQFQKSHPSLNIVSYDSKKNTLRDAVKFIIRKQEGYDVVLQENDEKQGPWAPAMFKSSLFYNLNRPEFFTPILRKQRDVAFGAHYCSLFGSAYLIGIIDNALTQLVISPDYFGNVYNDDPAFSKILIEYTLQKIASSSMAHLSRPGSDVLTLHLERAREGLQKIVLDNNKRKNFSGDYTKAQIARLLTWPDLFDLIKKYEYITSYIFNLSAFLCLYSFYRTSLIGEKASAQEGLAVVFSQNLDRLSDTMLIQVIGTILGIRSNSTDKINFPGGLLNFREILFRFGKKIGIAVDRLDSLDIIADKLYKILYAQQQLWLPTQIDLPDTNSNAPLIQALIARNEPKALGLLHAGANIANVYGHVTGWSIAAPLLTIALRCGMKKFAEALLKHPDFDAWDQSDGWQNTPLCDAIVMGLEDIAVDLLKRGARVDRRPNYAGIPEQDLISLATKKGLKSVAELLREKNCPIQITTQIDEPKRSCKMM